MKQVNEAVERVLRKMPKDELELLVHYADERGLDGIVERGGKVFRELASQESIEYTLTLGEFLAEANDIPLVVSNIGFDILHEETK